jgi:hypothetical protein
MKILNKLTSTMKDAYWDVVHDCLVEIHQFSPPDARALCHDRRSALEFAPQDMRSNIYYHREPFDVACELARLGPAATTCQGPLLSDSGTMSQYEAILSRHGLN